MSDCDEEREGNFCLKCGASIAPLNGLLNHLERIIKQQKYTLESEELVLKKPAIEKRKSSLAKWQSWHDALVELMDSKGGQP